MGIAIQLLAYFVNEIMKRVYFYIMQLSVGNIIYEKRVKYHP